MRGISAVVVPLSFLLAGCGSASVAAQQQAPPPASSSVSATTPVRANPGPSSVGARPNTSPELRAWASSFCTAVIPLFVVAKSFDTKVDLAAPDTKIIHSLALFSADAADVYSRGTDALRKVGSPPGGDTSGTVDAVGAAAAKLHILAAKSAAADAHGDDAQGSVSIGATGTVAVLGAPFDVLQKELGPDDVTAIEAAPECQPLKK